jgi:hypothetical protein
MIPEHEPGLALSNDKRSVGQARERLPAPRAEPRSMQACVDVVRTARADKRQERVVVGPAALGARPVTGRERRRLVEEEELCVPPGLHQR